MLDVLLVDDDDLVLQSLQMVLSSEGYAVRAAMSAEAALQGAREQLFDVVICDVRMPGRSGLELIPELQVLQPEATFLVITGYADENAPVQALRLGVHDYLRKPFDMQAFLERLRELRRKRRARGIPPGQILFALARNLQRFSGHNEPERAERVCRAAGTALGLSEDELVAARLAVLLSDLARPGPAAEEEPVDLVERVAYLLTQTDPTTGAGIPAAQLVTAVLAAGRGEPMAARIPPATVAAVAAAAAGEQLPLAVDVSTGVALTIRSLGEVRIALGDQEIPAAAWESAKARQLFFYLLSRGGQMVSQERLREMFWPDSPEEKAQRALVSTVHRIKKALQLSDLVVRGERTYGLNRSLGWSWDVDEIHAAARLGRAAERTSVAQAEPHYRRVQSLYRGDFLEECMDDWAHQVREDLHRVVVECLERLAEILLERDPLSAESAARAALGLDRISEAAYAVLIRSLTAQGRRDEATRCYQTCERRLRSALDLSPGAEVTRAYLEATAPA